MIMYVLLCYLVSFHMLQLLSTGRLFVVNFLFYRMENYLIHMFC